MADQYLLSELLKNIFSIFIPHGDNKFKLPDAGKLNDIRRENTGKEIGRWISELYKQRKSFTNGTINEY